MSEKPERKPPSPPSPPSPPLAQQVGAKAARKLRAQGTRHHVWLGLGMMGLVGWSVVVPTLLGLALGSWIDHQHWDQHSWTLALLVAGLVLGCFNAWHWVTKEERAIHAPQEEKHDD